MDDVSSLAQKAIEEALSSNWEGAIAKNQEILLQNPNDLEAKNRLAKAYLESGKIEVAKKLYREVLEIDPYNQIALKNLKRVEGLNGNGHNKNNNHQLNSAVFLSEPGKTKLVNLVHLATPQSLSSLSPGEQLTLQAKKHTICVLDQDGQYIGALPDDISHLLISLMAGGNLYETYVKKASANCLQVIIWEKYRSKRFISQPSFLPNGKINYYPCPKEETKSNEQILPPECEEELIEEENWSIWK
jgi:tetratricopeptide (TPR) repeat protein